MINKFWYFQVPYFDTEMSVLLCSSIKFNVAFAANVILNSGDKSTELAFIFKQVPCEVFIPAQERSY